MRLLTAGDGQGGVSALASQAATALLDALRDPHSVIALQAELLVQTSHADAGTVRVRRPTVKLAEAVGKMTTQMARRKAVRVARALLGAELSNETELAADFSRTAERLGECVKPGHGASETTTLIDRVWRGQTVDSLVVAAVRHPQAAAEALVGADDPEALKRFRDAYLKRGRLLHDRSVGDILIDRDWRGIYDRALTPVGIFADKVSQITDDEMDVVAEGARQALFLTMGPQQR